VFRSLDTLVILVRLGIKMRKIQQTHINGFGHTAQAVLSDIIA
jgi:hypothetical protein